MIFLSRDMFPIPPRARRTFTGFAAAHSALIRSFSIRLVYSFLSLPFHFFPFIIFLTFRPLLFLTGFYWIWLGFSGFYWVLLFFFGFYWVLLGFTGFYWVLLGFWGLAICKWALHANEPRVPIQRRPSHYDRPKGTARSKKNKTKEKPATKSTRRIRSSRKPSSTWFSGFDGIPCGFVASVGGLVAGSIGFSLTDRVSGCIGFDRVSHRLASWEGISLGGPIGFPAAPQVSTQTPDATRSPESTAKPDQTR